MANRPTPIFKPIFECSSLKTVGDPVLGGVCASEPWLFYSACKNLSRNMVFRFGCLQTHMYYFVVSGPKFAGLFSPNAGWIAVGHVSFHFWYLNIPSGNIRGRSQVEVVRSRPICWRFGP